jgi:XTP/dITP diphosphohydrolase
MKTICFATNNQHKLDEVKKQLAGSEIHVVSLNEIGCIDELPETQDTLEGNSWQKADFVFKKFGTSCFADDTGLEVAALNGAPGVHSAYYGGEQRSSDANIQRLLDNLHNEQNRAAQFRTIITFIEPAGIHTFEGIVQGKILTEKKGSHGFGYDPVFQPEGYDRSFAEMSIDEKNNLSHRARAVAKFISFLLNRNM